MDRYEFQRQYRGLRKYARDDHGWSLASNRNTCGSARASALASAARATAAVVVAALVAAIAADATEVVAGAPLDDKEAGDDEEEASAAIVVAAPAGESPMRDGVACP